MAWFGKLSAALVLAAVGVAGYGNWGATRDPIVHVVRIADPRGASVPKPIRILLMSDTHVQGPVMPPRRLERIVRQANMLRPDVIVLAGDFRGNSVLATRNYSVAEAVAPLAALRAPGGVYAVLGNHDRRATDETVSALGAAGINVLELEAVQLGPIAIGGFRTRPGSTLRRLLRRSGTRIFVGHSPDSFPELPPAVPLMLAGHTHCGQIVLPLVGALATGSSYGTRYHCGLIRENGKTLIVSAGLGTSRLPMRIGAPPDMWVVELLP
jgi:predicted MPP superfamily phosphohydrolase